MAGRYAHAKQFKRMNREIKFLRTRLGRVIRDIRRKIESDEALGAAFAVPLIKASQIRGQKQRQRGWKLYSWHAPETECIAKGKAHKPEHLGIAGRRVLVSRKWSNKSLSDHRAERTAFVRQLLDRAGVQPAYAVDDGPFTWETTKPGDSDVPPRTVLLLHAINQRSRWRADYDAAVLATSAGSTPWWVFMYCMAITLG